MKVLWAFPLSFLFSVMSLVFTGIALFSLRDRLGSEITASAFVITATALLAVATEEGARSILVRTFRQLPLGTWIATGLLIGILERVLAFQSESLNGRYGWAFFTAGALSTISVHLFTTTLIGYFRKDVIWRFLAAVVVAVAVHLTFNIVASSSQQLGPTVALILRALITAACFAASWRIFRRCGLQHPEWTSPRASSH